MWEEFLDLFTLGYNIGNCVGTSKQLSYSYDNVDIVSLLDNSYSASVSGVLIFGNQDFATVKDYEGRFVSVGGNISHAKAGAAFAETCFAVVIGATSSKKPAFGISITNYTLRGSFSIWQHSAEAICEM